MTLVHSENHGFILLRWITIIRQITVSNTNLVRIMQECTDYRNTDHVVAVTYKCYKIAMTLTL